MKRFIATFIIIFFSCNVNADDYFGEYSGRIVAEWLNEGREMRLTEDFGYTDPNGLIWLAPSGSVIDGASIPKFFWSSIGSPFTDKYREASVIHDVACQEKKRTWEVVHLSFYYAMRASGVSQTKAKIMYSAVYHFGPRWGIKKVVGSYPEVKKVEKCDKTFFGKFNCKVEEKIVYHNQTVFIEPPQYSMSEEEFFNLATEIEEAEKSGAGVSLKEIQSR